MNKQDRIIDYQVHSSLDRKQQQLLDDVIQENNDIFYLEGDQLGSVSFVYHEIPLQPGTRPAP